MPRNSHRPLVALGALSLLLLSGPGARGADSLSSVVEQFRQGRYSSSYHLARETAESPRRQFLLGVTALRLEKYEEALGLLREVEAKLPLVGDYAALRQAEALFRLKRYPEAAARAAAIPAAYPSSLLVRQAEKLQIDSLAQAGDHQGVLRFSKNFIEKYPSGSDSVEVLFQSGRSREETGASQSAVPVFRSIWIDNPRSPQASAAAERLKVLEKAGMQVPPYSPEELLRRASSLFSQREFSLCLKTLQSISLAGAPEGLAARVSLRAGLAHYRLRHYKDALAAFARAAAGNAPTVSSEARLWHSRTLERQDHLKEAFAGYMELVGEGRKQEYAAEALMEAAGLRRGEGKPSEAARLYGQVAVSFPDSRFISRAEWEAAWCHYLAAEYPQAVEGLKKLVSNGAVREKALYWLGRSLEKSGGDLAGAADCFRLLQEEYPAGFYATWHREQRGIKDPRIPLPQGTKQADAVLPPAFDKARLLASLGMDEDARREASAARKKVGEKKSLIPALAQFYREMGNYSAVISLFQQNLPTRWEKESLPLWSAGYPLAYSDAISRHTAANSLPESLVYALIRAESSFSPGARSPVGAIGLMQLMPSTAKATAKEKGEFDPERLTVPEYNITLGTRHFRDLLKGHDGDLIYSVAAYNAGSSAVERWKKNLKGLQKDEFIESIPYQETRDYVKKVYASAATYRQLYGLK